MTYINRNDGHRTISAAVVAANPQEFVRYSSVMTRPGAKVMRLDIAIAARPASCDSRTIRTESWTVRSDASGSLVPERLIVTERAGVVA